jgi:hypothetical protein
VFRGREHRAAEARKVPRGMGSHKANARFLGLYLGRDRAGPRAEKRMMRHKAPQP